MESMYRQSRTWRLLGQVVIAAAILFSISFSGCTKEQDKGAPLRFVTWKPNQPEAWEEIYRLFATEHPDIRLERETGPHSASAYHDLLAQKLKNKSTDVDVFLMDVTWPPEFGSAGWAQPLDDLLPLSEREKFLSGAILANTYEGHIYGAPLYVDSGVLYYRTDLLDKYGFDPPATWEEMVEQSKTIMAGEANAGNKIEGFSGQFKQYEGLVCNMLEYILSNGGEILDEKTGRSAFQNKPSVDAVTFVKKSVIGNIAPRGVLTYQEPESLALFVQGKAVFLRNWPYVWNVANNPEKSTVAGKVGIARLPHFPGGRSYSTLGGWQVGVSSYSKNKKAAWAFVEFLTGEKAQRLLALKAGLAPTRTALYKDPEIIKSHPHLAQMEEVFLTAYPRPRSPLYPAISNVLQRYFSAAISEPASNAEKEAMEAAKKIDALLDLTRNAS